VLFVEYLGDQNDLSLGAKSYDALRCRTLIALATLSRKNKSLCFNNDYRGIASVVR